MKLLEGISIALSSLLANKLRSVLTLIGVIIGVMAVIAVTSIIAGMNKYVSNEISFMGSDTFQVSRFGIITSDEAWWEAVKRKPLTLKDVEALKSGCEDCNEVGAAAYTEKKVKRGREYINDATVEGATANLSDIVDVKVAEGRYISRLEDEHNRQVAFIGWEIKDKLFPSIDPIGKQIKIDNTRFEIIGVAEKKGSFFGQSQDNFVHVPLSTFLKHFASRRWRSINIFVRATGFESMDKAMDEVRLILRARRNVPYDKKDDFDIVTVEAFMDFYRQFTSTAYLTMIGISSIALVVGGIVIMNIMLVSVTERTREIGIRKALGARRRDVLWQFLVESVTLALVGGIIGVFLGVTAGKIVSMTTPLPAAADPFWIGIGIFLATSIGLVFGVYPAMKAARLDPIEALRHE